MPLGTPFAKADSLETLFRQRGGAQMPVLSAETCRIQTDAKKLRGLAAEMS